MLEAEREFRKVIGYCNLTKPPSRSSGRSFPPPYRRLRVRYERRADIHQALLTTGCCLICFKQLQAAESL